MIETLLSSQSKEQVLLFIIARGKGYARQIAQHFECSITPIKNQLETLEAGGVLVQESIGRSKIFSINPRYIFREEVTSLIQKVISIMQEDDREKLLFDRRRPRRSGKPI